MRTSLPKPNLAHPAGTSHLASVPDAGRKSRAGFSAYSRASMAWPSARRSSCENGRRSPAATRSCSSTRSSPVIASVTGCSTCRRVFISMKKCSPVAVSTMNSTVPALTYPTARAAATAEEQIRRRNSSVSPGAGASSSTFWWRLWTLQSRSNRCTALPWPSARTWTSTWRGAMMKRSSSTLSSPNAAAASRLADPSASSNSPAERASFMPFPPPPITAFTSSGNPMRAASAPSLDGSWSSPWYPGTTGTPAADMISLASRLSPKLRIAEAGGPTNLTPLFAQASAKQAFSDRKP
mmetsp:Transcript_20450/g.48692  ORF Transcript_20450/g.48692 Transcript_20450/m.48692 type:complete len:295 (+) Transcript_20450:1225-2109(+)